MFSLAIVDDDGNFTDIYMLRCAAETCENPSVCLIFIHLFWLKLISTDRRLQPQPQLQQTQTGTNLFLVSLPN